MNDLGEFSATNRLDLFVATTQLLKSLDGRLGHAAMSLLGAADEYKLVSLGDAFMAVGGIQAKADETGARRGWL